MSKGPKDRFTAEELRDEQSRPTEAQLFQAEFYEGLRGFVSEFVSASAERVDRSMEKGAFAARRAQEAAQNSYRLREAIGRYLTIFLRRVRENQRDTKEASLLFFTHLSRIYWELVDAEMPRISDSFAGKARSASAEAEMTEAQWFERKESDVRVFFRDAFGRLVGAVNGMCVEGLTQQAVPEDGDPQTRGNLSGLLGVQ